MTITADSSTRDHSPAMTFTVHDLRAFLALNGRRPTDGKTAPAAERDLARWIGLPLQRCNKQVQRALEPYPPRRGRPARTKLPDSIITKYAVQDASTAEKISDPRLKQLAYFIIEHQHRPGASRDVVSDEESKLYFWMNKELNRGNQQVADLLDGVPGRAPRNPGYKRAEQLEAIKAFVAAHGRRPLRTAKDDAERRLASWIHYERRRVGLPDEIEHLLTPAGSAPREDSRKPFDVRVREKDQKMLEDLRAFCIEHDRLPSAQVKKKDERRLRMWITQQRIQTVPGLADLLDKYPSPAEIVVERAYDRRAALQRAAESRPPWPTNPQVMARLDQLRAFVAEHGTVPARRSEQGWERNLADWAYRHTRLPIPHPEVMELLESGGGYGTMAVMHTTAQRKEQLEAFVAKHQRVPNASAQDGEERALGIWAYLHQSRVNPDPEVLALIEQAGGYRTLGSTITWSGEYALFCAMHGRRPSVARKEEKRLTTWESRCDDRHDPSSVLGMLVAAYPTLQGVKAGAGLVAVSANKSVRLRRMKELTAFRAEHGRMPAVSSEDPIERSLAVWVDSNAHGPVAHPAVSALILGSVDVGTEDEQRGRRTYQTPRAAARPSTDSPKVLARLKELESFVEAHGKLPRSTTDDVAERRLGQWTYQQVRAERAHPRVSEIVDAHGGYRKRNGTS